MDTIYLMNSYISNNGEGIATYSNNLYNELSLRGLNVKKIEIEKYFKKSKIPFSKTIKRKLYFTIHYNLIKNKNIHVMSTGVLPKNKINLPKKKIITVHDLYVFNDSYLDDRYSNQNFIYNIYTKYLLEKQRKEHYYIKLYDYVIALNDQVKDTLIKKFDVDKNKIETIYNIIPNKFIPLDKKRNDISVIGFINNFRENKISKLKKFIEIFQKIKDKKIEFHIYGKNFPFLQLIKEDPRIKYFGFLPEEKIVETYNSFDCYLSTSTIEGFGIPIMQAKACKVPVLCYDGDIPEIVKRNTLIWNDNNLEEILKNRAWEKIDVEKAYLDAEECRADKVVLKTMNIYNKIFS